MDARELRFTYFATEAELRQRKEETLSDLVCEEPEEYASPQIPPDLANYLRGIHENPGLAATKRDSLLGISISQGSKMRTRLLERGLIYEELVNPGVQGRNFKDFRLTHEGLVTLQAIENREKTERKESR